jgi:hypothetical protein
MSAEPTRDELERAHHLAWIANHDDRHLAIARALAEGRREAAATGTDRTGARVVEAWRDRPVRTRIGDAELAELVWLIDETLLGARRQAVLEDRARRSSTEGDVLVIDDADDEGWR